MNLEHPPVWVPRRASLCSLGAAGAAAMLGARRATSFLVPFADAPPIGSWTETGTSLIKATGVADPYGGTDAVTTEDDDSGAFEYNNWTPGIAVVDGTTYKWSVAVKKDTDQTRFPEHLVSQDSNSYALQFNTETGASATRLSSLNASHTIETHPDDSGWWRITMLVTVTGTAGLLLYMMPARSTSLPGLSAAAVGELTWVPEDIQIVSQARP